MSKTRLALIATHITAAGIGFGIGYLVLKEHFKTIADEEIESVKEHYLAVHKDGPILEGSTMPEHMQQISPEALLALKEKLENGSLRPSDYLSDSETPEEQQQVLSIFDHDAPDDLVVLNQLLANREHELPYVITYEEFMEGTGFEQITLTFWDGDGVLMGDDEQIIPDITGTVGGALSYFGIGSSDPDTVYVRVESSSIDFEIVRDKREYGVVVHGADSIHEPKQKPKAERIDKMRGDD